MLITFTQVLIYIIHLYNPSIHRLIYGLMGLIESFIN